jgi:hypothetical protein
VINPRQALRWAQPAEAIGQLTQRLPRPFLAGEDVLCQQAGLQAAIGPQARILLRHPQHGVAQVGGPPRRGCCGCNVSISLGVPHFHGCASAVRPHRLLRGPCHTSTNHLTPPRTCRSFAVVIQQLPNPLRDAICVFYLVLRGLDTVEDDMAIPNDKKIPDLLKFHE